MTPPPPNTGRMVAALLAKANFMAGSRRICPHPEFEKMGGKILPAILHRGEGNYIRRDGSDGFDPDWIEHGAPIFSYRCTICGGMFNEQEHAELETARRTSQG